MTDDVFDVERLTELVSEASSVRFVYPHAEMAALGVFLNLATPRTDPVILADIAQQCIATLRPIRTDRAQLHAGVAACRRCVHATSVPTLPTGNTRTPRVVFIQERPLHPEREGPFLQALAAQGFTSENSVFTSLSRCRFTTSEDQDASVNRCWSWLMAELDCWRPDVVVAVGAIVTQALLHTKITSMHGVTHYIGAFRVFPLYSWPHAQTHPANQRSFTEDLSTLTRMLS